MIIKETGVGLSNANVYADVADLDEYAALIGEDLSAYDTAKKEAALFIAANKYIDGMHDFAGVKIDASQGLKLYTDKVTFADASANIIRANCDTAIMQLKGVLFPAVTAKTQLGEIKSERKKLGKLETETEYMEGSAIKYGTINTDYADKLLKPYLSSGGVKLVAL